MKKLLAILLSLGLILCLAACSASNSSNDSSSDSDSKSNALEPPVSDVTDGTGLEGTWREEETDSDDTAEMVQLALNSDGTFSLYVQADQGNNANLTTQVDGKYTSTDTELTLTPDEIVPGEDPGVFESDNDGVIKLTYKVDGDKLELTDSDGTETFTRQ